MNLDIDALNYANDRINYRRFSDEIPDEDLIKKIIQEAFIISPIQNLKPEFSVDIFGPKYKDEKNEFVLFTVCESDWSEKAFNAKTEDDLLPIKEYRKKNWDSQIYAGDNVNHLGFNHQVEAPYLLRFTADTEGGCIHAGIYSFAISLIACKYGIDPSFCKCFTINKNFFNPITISKSTILFYLGLGVYDKTLTGKFFEYKHNRKANFNTNSFIQWR